jgi:hypothetical protein
MIIHVYMYTIETGCWIRYRGTILELRHGHLESLSVSLARSCLANACGMKI